MATLTSQIDNLNKRVVALENSELEASDAVPFIVKLYADFEVTPVIECGDGGYNEGIIELIINNAQKTVTNRILNGDFSQGMTGWNNASGASNLAVNDNIFSFQTSNTQGYFIVQGSKNIEAATGDLFFLYSKVKSNPGFRSQIYFRDGITTVNATNSINILLDSDFTEVFGVVQIESGGIGRYAVRISGSYPIGTFGYVEGWSGETASGGTYVINLTQEFGAGNEPTAAQMKAAIDEYRARVYPECSEDTELTAGAAGAAEELSTKINYSAVGNSTLPNPGDTGVVGEIARKPVGSVTTVESSETETVIVFSSYFDEQAANGELLTSAAVLYEGTEAPGTGLVVASEAINIEKTSAKTLTVSTEITITEVV